MTTHADRFRDAHPLVREAADLAGRPIPEILADVMAPGGPLGAVGLAVRAPQVEMVAKVAQACAEDSWAAVHAPCGTGKGLAYLLAGVLYRERAISKASKEHPVGPVVVSTSNISLQSQLVTKDVPLVAKILGLPLKATVLKGRANYICPREVLRWELQTSVVQDPSALDRDRLIRWWRSGGSGDREDVRFSYAPRAWGELSRDSRRCIAKTCAQKAECPSQQAKTGQMDADVVVTNHSYLAVGMLPPRVPLLVIDEAHSLESALLRSGSKKLSASSAERTARRIANALSVDEVGVIRELIEPVKAMIARATRGLPPGDISEVCLPGGWCGPEPAKEKRYGNTLRARLDLEMRSRDAGPAQEEVKVILDELDRLRDLFRFARAGTRIVELDEDDPLAKTPAVVWLRRERGRDPEVRVGLPDVATRVVALRRLHRRAVLCSATLASAGDRSAFMAALGMGEEESTPAKAPEVTAVLPSAFDLPAQALVVAPYGPSPKESGWRDWRTETAVEAVRRSGGGALILSSSWSGAREMADALRRADIETPSGPLTRARIQLQGEMGRAEQLKLFAEDEDGVLVGTRSFFEGVDIPGNACRLVLVDRIPFGSPSDPLERAVVALAEERYGANGFALRTLPEAVRLLEQAAGRLIRSATDRGVFVLLDPRAHQPGMIGAKVKRALEPMTISQRLSDIDRWLGHSAP